MINRKIMKFTSIHFSKWTKQNDWSNKFLGQKTSKKKKKKNVCHF